MKILKKIFYGVVILVIIIKRKKKGKRIALIDSRLQHLKELKARGEISEKTYHVERERLLQRVKDVFSKKTMSIIFLSISLITLIRFLTINKRITGYALEEPITGSSGSFIYIILLVGSLGLLAFIHRQKIKIGISKIKEKYSKKYPANSIKGVMNKKVYTDSGDYIGTVREIILEKNKIYGLKIKLDKKRFSMKGIIVKWKYIASCGEIVTIKSELLNFLN